MKLVTLIVTMALVSIGYACNCGWANKGRIVGGKIAKNHTYPFIAAILDKDNFQFCAGTIITPWHILTADHCTNKGKAYKIRVGVNNLKTDDGDTYYVARIINNEDYDSELWINDISLIVTKRKINFNQNVGPICMPTGRLALDGKTVRAIGWGRIAEYRHTKVLMEVDLSVTPFEECKKAWSLHEHHPQEASHICVFASGKSTCRGDSGGPILYLNPETRRYMIVALVSYGIRCGGPIPNVNTDVGAFIPWIKKHIASVEGAEICSGG